MELKALGMIYCNIQYCEMFLFNVLATWGMLVWVRHINMVWITVIILLFIVVANYLYRRDMLYPGNIQALSWMLIMLFYGFVAAYFYTISVVVQIIIVFGVISFSMGSFVASSIRLLPKTIPAIQRSYFPQRFLLKLLLMFSVLGMFLLIRQAVSFAESGPFPVPFMNIRYALSEGADTGGYGRLSYFLWLAYFTMAVHLIGYFSDIYNTKMDKMFTAISTIIALSCSVVFAGKGFLLWWMIILIFVPLVFRKVNYMKVVTISLTCMFVIFIVYGFLLKKGADIEENASRNITTISETIMIYLLSPIPAFNQVTLSADTDEFPKNSLIKFTPYLKEIGFFIPQGDIIKEFIDVPYATNIYTIHEPYYRDLGFFGPLSFQFIIGVWHGFLYRKVTAARVNPAYVIFFIFFMYPLIIQYMGDFYLTGINVWLLLLLFSSIFFINKLTFLKKNA